MKSINTEMKVLEENINWACNEITRLSAINASLLSALEAIEDHHNETDEWRDIASAAIAKAKS